VMLWYLAWYLYSTATSWQLMLRGGGMSCSGDLLSRCCRWGYEGPWRPCTFEILRCGVGAIACVDLSLLGRRLLQQNPSIADSVLDHREIQLLDSVLVRTQPGLRVCSEMGRDWTSAERKLGLCLPGTLSAVPSNDLMVYSGWMSP
jgi:hypothetical protein